MQLEGSNGCNVRVLEPSYYQNIYAEKPGSYELGFHNEFWNQTYIVHLFLTWWFEDGNAWYSLQVSIHMMV